MQVWSLSSFKVSCQLLTNDLNRVSSVSLLMTSSTALANEGLFELTRRPSLTRAVSSSFAETTEEPGCSQVKRPKFCIILVITDPQQHSPKQQEPFQQKSPHSSPPFHGWNPVECKLDRNKSQYETDEEEFEDLNEGFWEPPSTLVTPRKRPADDDYASSSRNCRPRLD